jgi:outer membrane receptor protein involved in Fe transport
MIHLRIKPTSNFYMHFAYTQTLSRPDFNVITPNYYVSTGEDFQYSSNNPTIKPEQWTNLDAQFVLHGKKMGLFSVNLFYKTVKDKIWYRNYTRIKGDPIIDPFPNTAVVDVSIWENHSYKGFVRGVEVDWQTHSIFYPNHLTI